MCVFFILYDIAECGKFRKKPIQNEDFFRKCLEILSLILNNNLLM
jgi:hypothetical protein